MSPAPLHILMTADAVGGVWTYVLELARALAPHHVTITLATMGPLPSSEQRNDARRLGNLELHSSRHALEWMDEPWGEVDAAGAWLLELSARTRPDVVHLNGYAHAALPWAAPTLVVAHSCVLSWRRAVKGGPPPEMYDEYRRRVEQGLRAADVVIAPTAAMLDELRELYCFFQPAEVIPNGRASGSFAPAAKQPIIFSAGRVWDEAKNIALLRRIAPRLLWPVHIAGDPSPPQNAEPFGPMAAPGPRAATLLGYLPPDVLGSHLGAAAIYAAPALYEPFGLSILEAALSGCALVLADLPSLRENWDGAALFLPPGDDSAWCAALNALTRDEARRQQLAMGARERARRFDPAAMAGRYLAAYQALRARRSDTREEVALR